MKDNGFIDYDDDDKFGFYSTIVIHKVTIPWPHYCWSSRSLSMKLAPKLLCIVMKTGWNHIQKIQFQRLLSFYMEACHERCAESDEHIFVLRNHHQYPFGAKRSLRGSLSFTSKICCFICCLICIMQCNIVVFIQKKTAPEFTLKKIGVNFSCQNLNQVRTFRLTPSLANY